MSDQRNIDVGQSADGSALVSGDHNQIDQSRTVNNVVNNYYGPLPNQPPSQRTDRNEKILLGAVWAEVQDRLNQSLHNAVLLNLGKAEQRHQVSRPWDSQLRIADQASRPLDPETAIVEVFDRKDINGRLLILGNPGAGKTTTMLDLAAALVQRANTDPTQPIPVMFNLSSWQDDKQTLKDWLLSELKLKYGVSTKLGQPWLEAQTLLPLLDGLDELPPHRQEPAVQKINDWLQSGEGASQLLVCSRREEYELYATKLLLNGAICLEPLTDNQLATYFASLGMEPLWHTVRQDPDFLALVRTPLLLSVSILANDNIDPAQWQRLTTPQERLDYLLDAYIQRQLHAPIASRTYPPQKQPTPQQTRHWLTWLAQQLQAQSEDEFSIEAIQPSILASRSRLLYRLSLSTLFGVFIAILNLTIYQIIHKYIVLVPINQAFLNIEGHMIPAETISSGLETMIVRSIWLSTVLILLLGVILGLRINHQEINLIESFSFYEINNKKMIKWLVLGFTFAFIFGLFSFGHALVFILFSPRIFIVDFAWEEEISLQTLDRTILFSSFSNFTWKFTLSLAIFWSFCWLVFGVARGFGKTIILKNFPGQGILNNIILLEKSFFLFLIMIFCGNLALIPSSLYSTELASVQGGTNFIVLCLISSFVMSLLSFGFPLIQHFILRVALTSARKTPWNYARFLNHCTERLLLQRVGGRYRFIHRLIQERFAATAGHRLLPP